ncbi:TetR/AcrR family transcriptional regulator [Ferrimonas lipolytica]|uniref:TetR/AcrR family transcriptional regulator n=1 Tax=Ferrimonas lipolytica TaxID=2724191 RepID=A0A6H1U923_9GAMM|nr:TetR/AcrR family transcriptional regulator [Ferrimonas lipolytica]QIZ75545.1 TetR/AcrR family transcriptional regulator [Ferrimonas lipolytica]
MKTRDRILEASINLFNRAGTVQVNCVDIAAELGISPGNLYYHFRGKEEILTALMAEFELALLKIYQRFSDQINSDDDFRLYVHSLLKIGHHFRFLFRDQSAFRFADNAVRRSWARMMRQLQQISRQMLDKREQFEPLGLLVNLRHELADNLLLNGLATLSLDQNLNDDAETVAARGVAAITMLLAPYHVPPLSTSQ